jgi:adenylate cyclase
VVKQHFPRIALGIALVLLLLPHAARWYNVTVVDRLDALLYDYRLRLTMPGTQDDRVVIVDIDETSLKQEGRWPWGRDRLALLVDKLMVRYGVTVLGFDVVFSEPDESSGLRVLEQLGQGRLKDIPDYQAAIQQIKPQLEYDRVFAASLSGKPVVLGYVFLVSERGVTGVLPTPALSVQDLGGRSIGFFSGQGYTGNLELLQSSAMGAGHFNPLPDFDGVTRRVPILAEYQGKLYEALSLAMVRAVLGMPRIAPGLVQARSQDYSGLEWLELETARGSFRIPVDQNVATLVPYRGKRGSFRYVSASDVLRDRVAPEVLKDKIVLVGTTAPGLFDLRATPVESVYPGVEIHANLITGILDQRLKLKPPYVVGAEVVQLLVVGGLLSLILPFLTPLRATLVSTTVLLLLIAFNFWVWSVGNLVLPLASALLAVIGVFIANMSYGYFVEARSKRKITGLFGRYVSPALVEEMSKHLDEVSMEGDSREMSVLFSDVRGFTTLSEGMEPRELSELMNEFLTPLTQVIYEHRGTVDKYMGDCIMAFWGAPLADNDHARNAVLAGLEMQQRLAELQPRFRSRKWPEIKVGVGVNSGRMSVGNMGSEIRVAYTVMGDAVNLASRLEGITKQYGVAMLVGEQTKAHCPDVVFRELDRVRVKGKEAPVAIFEPIGLHGQVERSQLDQLRLFQEVLRTYRVQDWDRAEMSLLNLVRIAPATPIYEIYAKRIKFFRANPPGRDWDGVFVFETK